MLLNWCSPRPAFRLTVISKVLLADTAPPTRDIVIMAMFSIWMYVAGFGTKIKLLSKKYRRPSLALIEHLTPLWPWWLRLDVSICVPSYGLWMGYDKPDKVLRRHDDLLARKTAENLGYDLMDRFLITRLQLVLVASLHQFTAYYVRKPRGGNPI